MKYEEYQIWYHTYNIAIKSLLRNPHALDIQSVINQARTIADAAIETYSKVEEKPSMPNIDMQGFLNNILNDAKKKK